MSDTPISDSTPPNVADLAMLCRTLERLASVRLDYINQLEANNDAANAEIRSLKFNIDRVMGMYASKDNQICNLLNICRSNGIDVGSQDLIHGKEDKL